MIELLIKKGADKEVTANFYGGLYDTKTLAETSAHPKEAGILDEIMEVLS